MDRIDYDKVNLEDDMILVDKPAGISSFGVVNKVRWELTQRVRARNVAEGKESGKKKVKVGHTGTLDPFATGLLILMVGKGTKRCQEFLRHDKEYIANVRLGKTSTTGDPEGEISEMEGYKEPSEEEIANVVKSFIGEIEQRVPAYSAVKINGQRAYDLARKGKEVEMPVKKVHIYNIEILGYEWPDLKIRCEVGAGTYIRQLGMDIGEKLGTGAYLTELRRTKIDKYSVEKAYQI